jgi:P-type Cu+ transporter
VLSVETSEVELTIGGMTCASCAARVEKKLNRMDGVTATVNYATEKARVSYPAGTEVADLIATVVKTGYTAEEPPPPAPAPDPAQPAAAEAGPGPAPEQDALRRRLVVSALLAAPVVLLSMIGPLQFDNWQWLSLTLAAPVVVWGALPFHRAAWTNLRHGAATMDTLVSTGTLAAFGWSLWALFFGTAGMPGMRHGFDLTAGRTDGASVIYLEVAAGVTVFILLGRYLEARSKRQSGAALRALMDMGAKDVAVLRDGTEVRVPVDRLAVGDRFVVRPGEKIATTASSWRAPPPSMPRCSAASPYRSTCGRASPSPARPSTPPAGWSSRPPPSARTPGSPAWRSSWRTPRTARRRCSGSPTGSRRSSYPSSCCVAGRDR